MDDTKFLIIINKGENSFDMLETIRENLDDNGFQIKCITDFEGICDYCDGVRKILKDAEYNPVSIRMPLVVDTIPLYSPLPSGKYDIPLYM